MICCEKKTKITFRITQYIYLSFSLSIYIYLQVKWNYKKKRKRERERIVDPCFWYVINNEVQKYDVPRPSRRVSWLNRRAVNKSWRKEGEEKIQGAMIVSVTFRARTSRCNLRNEFSFYGPCYAMSRVRNKQSDETRFTRRPEILRSGATILRLLRV